MPVFQFTFQPPTAGCVSRVVVQTPWAQPGRNPQTGATLQPPEAAWQYLIAVANQRDQAGNCALYFPPQVQTLCNRIGEENGPPRVLAVEKFEATADRQQTNAPYNAPVGNGQSYAPPPEQPQRGAPRMVPEGMYEQLPDCALANTSDPVMGEMDGEGGTYTDIDSMGREVVRQHAMPPSPKVTDRR